MSRRQVQQGDSLEMLLDTMCNTFGGIILIALLIALLARDVRVSESEFESAVRSEQSVQRQIDQAKRDLEQTRSMAQALEAKASSSPTRELVALLEARAQARRQLAAMAETQASLDKQALETATSAQQHLEQQIESNAASNRTTQQKLLAERNLGESLRGRLNTLAASLREASNQLAQAASQNSQRLRLPSERTTTKAHFYIIVQGGRMHPLYYFQDGLPTQNTSSLQWERMDSANRRVKPIPGRGIDIARSPLEAASMLTAVPKDRVYLIFQLYEDSFAAFDILKPLVIRAGLDYTWEPRRQGEDMILGPGGQAPGPQ